MQGTKTDAGVLFEVEGEEPINASLDDNDNPRYQSDSFRMLFMKVLPCCKRFVHDWSDCPFSHPGEKARRRDPKVHHYTGIACPDMKKTGSCPRGDRCPYAHNVFEYWLHPTRYRSQLCNDGPKCRRRVCFFAHTIDQLRVPSSKRISSGDAPSADLRPGQMEVGKFPVPSEPIAAAPAPADSPYIHSPSAAQEPPVRNMSTSTASTSGSLELPPRPSTESEAAGSSTFVGAQQTISFAPPEGFMDVDRSDKSSAVAAQPSEGVPSSSADANSGAALQDVAASLANVKDVIRSGAADRYQVIDMLTNLLRETLQDTPGASALDALRLASGARGDASAAPPADPFTAAAKSSFDAPWPAEDAAAVEVAGQAPTAAAISAALSAAFSAQLQASATEAADAGAASTAAAAQLPGRSVPLLLRGGLPAGQLPMGAGMLGQAPGAPRQSSAPDALLSARSGHAPMRPTTTDGTCAQLPQPPRTMDVSSRRAAAATSTQMQAHHQKQAAVQQQQQQRQLIQQLQQRRAALLTQGLYKRGGGGSSLQSQVSMGRSPPVSTASALEGYSRTGDVRLLQHTSALMGSPDAGQARSLSADYGMPGMYGYDAQLEMGGLARGSFEGLNPRHLLYPEAFAHTNFQDMSGAAFMGEMDFGAPRAGSAPAYLDSSSEVATGADPYEYGSYGVRNPQMFGSAYSGIFPAGGAGEAGAANAFDAGYLAAAGALERTPSTSQPTADWTQQQ